MSPEPTGGHGLLKQRKLFTHKFGKDHLKSLSFFFCTVGDKKIGMNYRNNLAHWIGLRDRDINSMLVAKLFFLYTDVINTIFWYFCKEGWDELEQ